MVEILHIKYEFDEALTSKKDILNSEVNFINIQKRMEAYKILRMQEIKKMAEIKSKINELANKISFLYKTMPKTKMTKIQEVIEEDIEEVKKTTNLQKELEDIQEKLARLE